MATSRSFGASSVTSRPPIITAPAVTSSSPASMRSAVVLPEPDGPTRTMNSPSSICRSSAFTAGASLPGYTHVALSKRTSAIVSPNRHRLLGAQLRAHAFVRRRPGAERVEREERGAEDRRRRRRVRGDRGADLGEPARDRAEQPRRRVTEKAAAEDDLDRLALEPEAGDGDAGERDDLVCEMVDDRGSDRVVGRRREDDRSELDRTACVDALEVHRLSELARAREPEMLGHEALEHGLRSAAVLAARSGPHGVAADIDPAAPVACRPPERAEARLAAVGRNADTVDAGAADHGDAPARSTANVSLSTDTREAHPRPSMPARTASSSTGKSTPASSSSATSTGGPSCTRSISPPMTPRAPSTPRWYGELPPPRAVATISPSS